MKKISAVLVIFYIVFFAVLALSLTHHVFGRASYITADAYEIAYKKNDDEWNDVWGSGEIYIGQSGDIVYRSFLSFDVGYMPEGAIIRKATLEMTYIPVDGKTRPMQLKACNATLWNSYRLEPKTENFDALGEAQLVGTEQKRIAFDITSVYKKMVEQSDTTIMIESDGAEGVFAFSAVELPYLKIDLVLP